MLISARALFTTSTIIAMYFLLKLRFFLFLLLLLSCVIVIVFVVTRVMRISKLWVLVFVLLLIRKSVSSV